MDFALLQVFKAVADEGTITGAARKLHRVPSNVTTRLKQLEATLGKPLFDRERGRLTLSPEGRVFLSYVEQLLRTFDEARAAVSTSAPGGTLRLGTLESTAASRLPPLLASYHRNYPGVRIELTTGTAGALTGEVLDRKVDAAFIADCVASPELELVPAFEEELVLIAPQSHPAIRSARDVRTATVIAFPNGCAYRRRLQGWLAQDGVIPERVLELSSYHAIVACVASGTGIALTPRAVLDVITGAEHVSIYPLAAKSRAVTSLVWRKGEDTLALRALQVELASRAQATTRAHGRKLTVVGG